MNCLFIEFLFINDFALNHIWTLVNTDIEKYQLWLLFMPAVNRWIYQHILLVLVCTVLPFEFFCFCFFSCTCGSFSVCIYRWLKTSSSLLPRNTYILPSLLNYAFVWFLWLKCWITAHLQTSEMSTTTGFGSTHHYDVLTFLVHRDVYLVLSTALPFLIKYINNKGEHHQSYQKKNSIIPLILIYHCCWIRECKI